MNNKTKWLFEFSKRVVQIIISLYVVHIIYVDALAYFTGDITQIGQITDDLTQVVCICLGGYLFKAALENVFKIKGNSDNEY